MARDHPNAQPLGEWRHRGIYFETHRSALPACVRILSWAGWQQSVGLRNCHRLIDCHIGKPRRSLSHSLVLSLGVCRNVTDDKSRVPLIGRSQRLAPVCDWLLNDDSFQLTSTGMCSGLTLSEVARSEWLAKSACRVDPSLRGYTCVDHP